MPAAITTQGRWFKDGHGRTLLLRGVNLGGSSKVPYTPDGATHIRDGFFEHRDVSFVGRPFPLDQADEHFSRLRSWGFTLLRFLVTWEAVEHAGPGIYDRAYLDYLYQVIQRAAHYDISVFIDPHQDVWSRFCGGDGAPGWTFEALGMDITRFKETGAAIVHQTHGDPLPHLIWATNGGKFACATMFTLFFGGDHFAPQTRVDGVPVSEYLQRHYVQAMQQVAERLKDLPNVVGYETMNEPLHGFIGCPADQTPTGLKIGEAPTIFQGMALAAGYPQEVELWKMGFTGLRKAGTKVLNPGRVSLWRDGYQPVWQQNGVWDLDRAGQPQLLRPDHFQKVDGQTVDFARDYFRPFVARYVQALRAVDPHTLIFVGPEPAEIAAGEPGHFRLPELPHLVYAPHWYDGLTLGTRRYIPWLGVQVQGGQVKFILGHKRVRRAFARQIQRLVEQSQRDLGDIPTLIGETGIPFDLNGGKAYRGGNFSPHMRAIDDTVQALDANLVSFTWWNYTADNTNARGDQWNGEDLSIFGRDQVTGSGGLDDGGRALGAIVRPYARKIAGEPLHMSFDLRRRVFLLTFRHHPHIDAPTEIFVPDYQYRDGYAVSVSGGTCRIDPENQILLYSASGGDEVHTVRIQPA